MPYCFLSDMSKTVIILNETRNYRLQNIFTACNLKNITIVDYNSIE